MLVTVFGMTVFLQPATSLFVDVSMMALHPFLESYVLLLASTVIEEIDTVFVKALVPIDVTPLGIVISVNAEQSMKAPSPIAVTAFGIVTPDIFLQVVKALVPIEVTPLGIVMPVNAEHPPNNASLITVTPLGIVIAVNAVQLLNVLAPMLVTVLGIVILVKAEQALKAASPIEVMLFGIVTLESEVQAQNTFGGIEVIPLENVMSLILVPLKALSPILVTVSGIVIAVNLL